MDVLQDYVRNNNATINVSNKIPLDVLQDNFPDPQKDLFKCDSVAPRSKHPLWGGTNRRTEDNNKYKSTTAVSGKLPTDFTALHANNKIHNGLGSCPGLVLSPFDRFLLIGPSAKGGPALFLLTKPNLHFLSKLLLCGADAGPSVFLSCVARPKRFSHFSNGLSKYSIYSLYYNHRSTT